MNTKNNQNIIKAFVNAGEGLGLFFIKERNGKIQAAIGFAALALSVYFKINLTEWIEVLFCIGMVLSLEMMNSALEKLCDIVHPDFHPAIKIIKDVSAAAVLWMSIISTVIGGIIFLPKIFELI